MNTDIIALAKEAGHKILSGPFKGDIAFNAESLKRFATLLEAEIRKEFEVERKILDKRIHNQRLALRENWQIAETRQKYRKTPLRTMWFDLAIARNNEIARLTAQNIKLMEDATCYRWLVANAHPIIQFKIEWKGRMSDWTPDKEIVSVQYYTWDGVSNSIKAAIADNNSAALTPQPEEKT